MNIIFFKIFDYYISNNRNSYFSDYIFEFVDFFGLTNSNILIKRILLNRNNFDI